MTETTAREAHGELIPGAFYWAMPAFDVDQQPGDEWRSKVQPARFVCYHANGYDEHWCWLGSEVDDWPAIWIGPIIPERQEHPR